jgi:hypothetical protein
MNTFAADIPFDGQDTVYILHHIATFLPGMLQRSASVAAPARAKAKFSHAT